MLRCAEEPWRLRIASIRWIFNNKISARAAASLKQHHGAAGNLVSTAQFSSVAGRHFIQAQDV
jgi:hypothetical protein